MGNSWGRNFHTGVFAGTVTRCSSRDDTWYCKFSRIFSAIMMCLVLIGVIFFIFKFAQKSIKG